MRKVKNKKVIRNLADKSFLANKSRNLIATVAIALTALLFTTLFTIGIGTLDNFQQQTMRQVGGDSHGTIKNISPEQYKEISKDPSIKESADKIVIANEITNQEFLKRRVEAWYYPEYYYPHCFIEIIDGKAPEAADEILLDDTSLQLLGKEAKSGQQVTIELRLRNSDEVSIRRTFTVSGVIKSDPALSVGFAIVSSAYLTEYASELAYTYPEDASSVGAVQMDVIFRNTFSIQNKLDQVILNAGYSTDEKDSDYIESNANWAYMSDGIGSDPLTTGALVAGLLLVILTGYLIIYNIFQIAVIRDIRYYGLLKTVGTTRKQVKKLIRRQALKMEMVGIPVGLIGGFMIGNLVIPKILSITNYDNGETIISVNPLIFIGAAIFTLFTVWISTGKPARMAAKVSPIEAVRYTETAKNREKLKKTTDGGKIARMAFSNLGRSKTKAVLVIISLSLAVILLNSVYTLTHSFDMDKFVSKFASTDFLVANAEYFNSKYRGGTDEEVQSQRLTESFIAACEGVEGFETGGRLYGSKVNVGLRKDSWKVPAHLPKAQNGDFGMNIQGKVYPYNAYDENNYQTSFYGMEDFLYQILDIWKGETDLKIIEEKLESGNYLLLSVSTDDNGQVYEDEVKHQPGDRITLSYGDGKQKEFEILALIKDNYFSLTNRIGSEFTYYTSANIFKKLVSEECLMSYAFNTADNQEAEVVKYLEEYTTTQEPQMHYESRMTWLQEFNNLSGVFLMIGGILAMIIGLIGILNFINSILTAIISRRRELAMLEAIGMSNSQLVKMLIWEGVYYALFTIIISITAGCIFSLTAIKAMSGGMWFMNYQFVLWPMLVICPFLLILGILVPYLAYRMKRRQSMMNELRILE